MSKITMNQSATVEDVFNDFIVSRRSKGVTDKTIESYNFHFAAVSRHLDVHKNIDDLQKSDIDKMIESMRAARLSPNTICTYTRMLKAFLSWCAEESIVFIRIKLYKGEETIKETYSDQELMKLLKKPNLRSCRFSEYRDWVIINFLLNSGCRAATLKNIQNRDVDMQNCLVHYRHTKSRKTQVIPLCSQMVSILREYMRIRKGAEDDYLFCTENGTQFKANALNESIARYNTRRGVSKTSIHMFRHTFARKYLVDCGGDAFMLQKLLGHSTLAMTKHYCAIFDSDITKNYDNFSPLAQMKKGEYISINNR